MIVKENIQQFKRGIDPKRSLGIGSIDLIQRWFEEFAPDAEYEVDDNFNINIKDNLYLANIKISFLPDNLEVDGYLNLENTNIDSLPNNLYVGGYLDLENTKITSLPDNLRVGKDLYLRNTKITSLPNNLRVKGKILKDF